MGAAMVDLLVNLIGSALMLGVASLASTWALLKGLKPRSAVLAAAATMAVVILAGLSLFQMSEPNSLITVIQKAFDSYWTLSLPEMVQQGFTEEEIGLVKMVFVKYVFQALPAWIAVNCLITGLLAYYLSSAFLSRVTLKVPKSLAFRLWIVPEPLVFGLILAGFLKIAFKEGTWMDILGNNLLVFLGMVYILGGISIIVFLFSRFRLTPFMRVVLLVTIFWGAIRLGLVFPIFFVGVMDIWFDFRKIKNPPPEPAP